MAVIAVVLFHVRHGLMPGGCVGVDVFFVISGFLITSIILREYDQGCFSFVNFWLRRIRRILPAMVAMVLATLVAGTFVLYQGEINDLGIEGIASLLSFANISEWIISGNYWGSVAESSPFLHVWSLSLEEQFYLFFPLLLILALRFVRRWVAWVLLLVVLASAGLFVFGMQSHPAAVFYLLPTRAWELGTGALFAVAMAEGPVRFRGRRLLSFAGVALMVLSGFLLGGQEGLSSMQFVPVLGAALVIACAGKPDDIVTRLLSVRPVVYIGKISYSLYLWHWPLLVYSRQWALKSGMAVNPFLLLVAMAGISVLSYHFIEVPTRRSNKAVPYVLGALLVGVGFAYFLKSGTHVEDVSMYNRTEWFGDVYGVDSNPEWPESVQKRLAGITVVSNSEEYEDAYETGGVQRLYRGAAPDVVVLGDSHALMWAKVLDEVASDLSVSISFFCAEGTPAFFRVPPVKDSRHYLFFNTEEKYAFDLARLHFLTEWNPRVVVVACRWDTVGEKETTDDLLRFLGGQGTHVLLIEQPPELFFGDKNTPQYLSYIGLNPDGQMPQYVRCSDNGEYRRGTHLVERIASAYPFCTEIPVSDIYLANGKAWVLDGRDVLYIDDDHLSNAGALKAKSRIRQYLAEQLR